MRTHSCKQKFTITFGIIYNTIHYHTEIIIKVTAFCNIIFFFYAEYIHMKLLDFQTTCSVEHIVHFSFLNVLILY